MKCFSRIPMPVTLAAMAPTASVSIPAPMAWAQDQSSTSQASGEDKAADDGPIRRQEVRGLPGGLDQVLVVNDNNPELISGEGILVSTFRKALGWIWP